MKAALHLHLNEQSCHVMHGQKIQYVCYPKSYLKTVFVN